MAYFVARFLRMSSRFLGRPVFSPTREDSRA